MRLWTRLVSQHKRTQLVAVLCGLVVIFHLVTAHAGHLQESQHPSADHTLHLDHAPFQALSSLSLDQIDLDCPIPSLLAPRLESLPGLLPIVVWFASALLILSGLQRALVATGPFPPRPPGPTRQALLQRFTL